MSSTKSRKDTRAVVALLARYRSPATFEYVQDACCDVSVGGMFIKSDSPAAAGTLIKLECETDTEGAKIRGVARVVWLRREPNEHGPTGMGVKFVKLESGSKEVITKLVQRLADAGVEPRSISAPPESASRPSVASPSSSQPKAQPSAASSSQPKAPFGTGSTQPKASGPSSKPAKPAAVTGLSNKPAPVTGHAPPSSSARAASSVQVEPSSIQVQPSIESPELAKDPTIAAVTGTPEIAAAVREPIDEPPPQATLLTDELVAAARPIAQTLEFSGDGPRASVPPTPRAGSATRVWIAVVLCVAVLLAIIFADDGPSSPNPATPAEPATAAPAATAAVAEPSEATPEQAPAVGAANAAAAAEKSTAQAEKPLATKPGAEIHHANPASARAAEPAMIAPTAEAPSGAASPSSAAADANAPTATPEGASAAPTPSVAAATGDYVIDFVSRPNGATISIDDHSIVAPAEMNIGPMPNRVKVIASKAGYEPSSAWVDRSGFKRVEGVFRRRVYMTLPVEAESTPPGKSPHSP